MSHYLPDGHGLPAEALELVAEHELRVHLRLTETTTRACRGACGQGLGELWTGVGSEVTCTACLEVVHA